MTRCGSLAYYLAAVVFGCVLMTLAVWLPGGAAGTHWTPTTQGATGFFVASFFGLLLGALPSLLFGFLLRRAAALLRARNAAQWVVAGVVLAPMEIWLLAKLADAVRSDLNGFAGKVMLFVVAGPDAVREMRLWGTLPVGALTALVLWRIHHTFEPREPAGV